MSGKEHERVSVLEKILKKEITQIKAAELLGISDRQVRNLLKAYKNEGNKGIISKKRGQESNRKYDKDVKSNVLSILSDKYEDFSPKFACEKLQERDGIILSKETVRKWMIDAHLWAIFIISSKRWLSPMKIL